MTFAVPTVLSSKKAASSSCPRVLRWFSVGLLIAGGLLLGRAWWTNDLASRSKDWPTTAGTVLHSRVVREGGKGESKFVPLVRYSYEVAGIRYESERRSLASSKTRQSTAEAICRDYPPGGAVTVHYDPEKPGESLLVVGPSHETVPLAVIGGILLVLSGFLFTRGLQTG